MNSFIQYATQPANGLDAVPSRQGRSMTSSASRFRAGLALALAALGALTPSLLGLGAGSARAEVRDDGAFSTSVPIEAPAKPSRFERVRAQRIHARDLRSREFRERLEQDLHAKARSAHQFRKRVSAGREAEAEHGAGRKPPFEERIEGGSE
jgi:hypothetical protein